METTAQPNAVHKASKLDGARAAAEVKREVAAEAEWLLREHHVVPRLVTILVGEDPASVVYVRNKIRLCEELGLTSEHHPLPATVAPGELLELIEECNGRAEVDGVLVQLPLPAGHDEARVIEAIDPSKDVDGFHPFNVGRLFTQQPALQPCTPAGIVELLEREGVEIRGARACVVGRSNIVGRPVAELLLQRDATVTVCHSRTRDLARVTREADILVAAVGRPEMIRGDWVKPGAVVIDVGINRVPTGEEGKSRIVGDVAFAEAQEVAGAITPVPGGVGPMTIAMLLRNTVRAAQRTLG